MGETEKNYELKVLKSVISKHLDKSISITSEGLDALESNHDQVVWDLATKIYQQSGHKVELSIVRDIVKSHIVTLKRQLRLEKERIAVEDRRASEAKAKKAAEEADRITIEEAKLRVAVENNLTELEGNESKTKVFIKVREIISEHLGVSENEVNLSSHLSNDLGADEDSYELIELVMALEEEFDIEISDDETEDELDIYYSSSYSGSSYSSSGSSGGSFWAMLGSISAMSSSSYSSLGRAGSNCIVKSFVNLIHKKLEPA